MALVMNGVSGRRARVAADAIITHAYAGTLALHMRRPTRRHVHMLARTRARSNAHTPAGGDANNGWGMMANLDFQPTMMPSPGMLSNMDEESMFQPLVSGPRAP